MGLDVVELVMRAEEEFGIELKDEDCALVSTCGQLSDLIQHEMGVGGVGEGCSSQRAFYRVRCELIELTGKHRHEITPHSLLQDLIPAKNRVHNWNELRAKLDLSLPDLARPNNIVTVLGWWVALSCLLVLLSWPLNIPWAFSFGSCVLCFLAFHITRPLAIAPPVGARTVGDISVRYAPRFNTLAPANPTLDLWPRVQKLIADELSVPLEKVTRDADFIRDLGAD